MSIKKSILKPEEMAALLKLKFGGKKIIGQHKNGNKIKDSNLAYCYNKLDKVSRSFAAVIRQLPDEVRDVVCLFYLILRALDSIEDDMDLNQDAKINLLREFYAKNFEQGWKLSNVGDKEEYLDLLANYDKVIEAFLVLDVKYQNIITDICQKMGAGMADFAETEITTLEDYNLYCHYVAGLVGIGLSELFAASEIESKELESQKMLSNSMGLFLQKTNIIRDYKEDLDENRIFWPEEVWSIYSPKIESFSLNPGKLESVSCLNHMVNDALSHATDCLNYLKILRNERVFRFCAIPQVMAIATLAEVYNNQNVFTENVKIRKGLTAKLILSSGSLEEVVKIYKKMASVIAKKIAHGTPNAEETSELIEKINIFCELALAEGYKSHEIA
ncbi:MAG: squalene synthase [Eudoraea sp.]|uniref:squalene synthase n=1 Tax=Eudoraea sp. TaxID=1979955 RepID=UPI003C77C5FA